LAGWVRDDIRDHLVEHLADPAAVLVVDAQVAVFLAYATTAGHGVYGGSPALRGWLETRAMPYVLAVKCTEPLPPRSGPLAPAARLAERVPPSCWLRISAGPGAKGRRWCAWRRRQQARARACHYRRQAARQP
jgi:hypothetical protein